MTYVVQMVLGETFGGVGEEGIGVSGEDIFGNGSCENCPHRRGSAEARTDRKQFSPCVSFGLQRGPHVTRRTRAVILSMSDDLSRPRGHAPGLGQFVDRCACCQTADGPLGRILRVLDVCRSALLGPGRLGLSKVAGAATGKLTALRRPVILQANSKPPAARPRDRPQGTRPLWRERCWRPRASPYTPPGRLPPDS